MEIGKRRRFIAFIGLMTMLISTTGCSSVYSSSFGCPDSPGAKCMPMDKVYKLIVSGEIERFTKTAKLCKGRGCNQNEVDDEVLVIKSNQHVRTALTLISKHEE